MLCHGARAVGRTGGQLEPFSMGKIYRGRLCRSFARNAGISFSYSYSMLDYSQCASRYHFVGWRPGTMIEQEHFLVLPSTILHRPLYSNMAANLWSFRDFSCTCNGSINSLVFHLSFGQSAFCEWRESFLFGYLPAF